MKIYQIALVIFLFNLSLSMLNEMHIFDYSIPADKNWSKKIEEIGQGVNKSASGESGTISNPFKIDVTMIFGDFITGLKILIASISNATVMLPYFLEKLGVPSALRTVLTAATWFAYAIGTLQFISGRSVKAYE